MIKVSRYPVDIEALQKGDVISPETLEDIIGHQRGTDKYNFGVMALQARIQNETPFTVRISSKAGLEVLTDAEAALHNHKQFTQAIGATRRRLHLNSQVDTTNLSDDQKKRHERNLLIEGHYVQAINGARKTLQLGGHSRNVPGLKIKEKETKQIEISGHSAEEQAR